MSSLPPPLLPPIPTVVPSIHQSPPPIPLAIPPPSVPPPKQKHNPTTVLLTHLPSFLRYPRNLRDWIYSCCGSVKSVAYSCEIKRSYVVGSHNNNVGSNNKENMRESVVAVVRMAHSSGAFNLVRNWDAVCARLLEENEKLPPSSPNSFSMTKDDAKMKAFFMYASNEHSIAFEPTINPVDAAIVESIWNGLYGDRPSLIATDESVVSKLMETYSIIKSQQKITDADPSRGEAAKEDKMDKFFLAVKVENQTEEEETKRKLDVNKVAAAAGGGAYDEEVDPLNAPAVLEAVAQFKKKLEEMSSRVKKKRAEYVDKRLTEEIKKVRVEKLKKKQEEEEKTLSLPPPLPPPIQPAIRMLPLPRSAPVDSGKRGVSNLPSWMTSKAQDLDGEAGVKRLAEDSTMTVGGTENEPVSKVPRFLSEANRDPNTRKLARLDTGDSSLAEIRAANQAADTAAEQRSWTKEQVFDSAACFPQASNLDTIRAFVKQQIVEYLGEEEVTLIDFVMNYLAKNVSERTTKALLDELSIVLEEDAQTFVFDLFKKVLE